MSGNDPWFSDDDDLLLGVQQAGSHWADLPEIPGYEELVELQRGGQGVVYRARQTSTNRLVAVKVLRDGGSAPDEDRFRFRREIELVAALEHPNIVRIYDSGVTPAGRPYHVMELVEGLPIDAACRERGLSLGEKLQLFATVCAAVDHAHQHGIIHRDLKPSNVLIDAHGAPHVLDFGLAKLAAEGGKGAPAPASRTGQFLGSLAWASPEQIERSPGRVGLRTDVYSLGAILYLLLTDRLAHDVASNLLDTVNRIATAPPVPPRSIRREIPDDLETIVLRCLAKDPERRYPTVGDLRRDVDCFLAGEPIAAKRDRPGYLLRKLVARHKLITGLAAALLVSVLVFAGTMAALYRRAVDAEQVANANLETANAQAERADAIQRFLAGILIAVDPGRDGREVRVIEILERAGKNLGARFADRPVVEAALRGTIGQSYRTLGMLDSAGEHLGRAVALSERHSGPRHRQTLDLTGELALLRLLQGRLGEAEELLERLLEDVGDEYGEEDKLMLATLSGLAGLRNLQGRPAESETLLRRLLHLAERLLGPTHPDAIRATHNLAAALSGQKKREEAEVFLRRALELHTDVHGPDHLHTVRTKANLGVLLMECDRLEDAEPLLMAGVEGCRRILGERHPETINFLHDLAVLRHYQGRPERALELAQGAVDAAVAVLPRGHLKISRYRSHLGTCLGELRRFDDAERELLAADQALRAQLGDDHPYTRQTAANLVALYEAWGQQERAEAWRPLTEAKRR